MKIVKTVINDINKSVGKGIIEKLITNVEDRNITKVWNIFY